MPITEDQAAILRLLSGNRSHSAYLAGGLISARDSDRFSSDIDYFHDSSDLALVTFDVDRACLEAAGYQVVAPSPRAGFVRADISKGGVHLKIDWAHEASWHFFQPHENPDVGFEVHWADAATNKVLAMASRAEVRDAIDVLHWHRNPLSLGALIWAASGKDLGLPPGLILNELQRNARISPIDIPLLHTVSPIDIEIFGKDFREATREADLLIQQLPPETVGNLFLDAYGNIIEPDPKNEVSLSRPLASMRGGLVPTISNTPEPF